MTTARNSSRRGNGTSAAEAGRARRVDFVRAGGKPWLMVQLSDGRAAGLPLSAFPTLLRATAAQRSRWRLIGRGSGIHWPLLDLDLSVHGLLDGRGERPATRAQANGSRRRRVA